MQIIRGEPRRRWSREEKLAAVAAKADSVAPLNKVAKAPANHAPLSKAKATNPPPPLRKKATPDPFPPPSLFKHLNGEPSQALRFVYHRKP